MLKKKLLYIYIIKFYFTLYTNIVKVKKITEYLSI